MADKKATLTAVLVDSVSGPAKKIQAEITGIGTTATRVSSVLMGVGIGIGEQLLRGAERGISFIAEAIPKLLDQGNSYLEQLHQIQLETGMTAEQTSTLVGALRSLGVPTESLDVLFARLGANIGKNEGLFRQLGVATRDSNGVLLNSYVIFQNLRQAVSEHGESLLSTAAAQELFGRSGFKIIEALQSSDSEWKAATENVRRWGGVVSQAAITGADRFKDTLSSLSQGITDIGVNIASAVDPYLRAFVDSFATFVQSHLNEIVNFAVAVVNTVTGFISGLFGITNALTVTSGDVESSTRKATTSTDNFGKVMKTAGAGADAFTTSINAQIKAIDAHIHAIEQAAERRRAVQERARLQDSLAAAQAQLADLRGNAPFLGGLSSAEQALALQKHAQDIIDAEKNVKDQRQALGDFEADQKDRAERELLNRQKQRLQDSLAAHKAIDAEILQSGLRMGAGLDQGLGTVLGNIGIKTQEFASTAQSSFQTGINAARGFLDIILGVEAAGPNINGSAGIRTGGVAGALKSIGDVFKSLGDVIRSMSGVFGVAIDFMTGAIRGFVDFIANTYNLLRQIINGTGNVPGGNVFVPQQGGGLPQAAEGAFVRASAGGSVVRVAEGGEDEAIMPLSKMPGTGGPSLHFHFDFISMPSDEQIRQLVKRITREMEFALNHAPVTSLPSGSF